MRLLEMQHGRAWRHVTQTILPHGCCAVGGNGQTQVEAERRASRVVQGLPHQMLLRPVGGNCDGDPRYTDGGEEHTRRAGIE